MASLTILPIEEIKSTPFVDKNGNAAFYRLLADARGMNWDTIGKDAIDPTKIYVSRALFDEWMDYAETKAEKTSLAMLLVNYGPKVDESLEFNMVRIDN